MDYGDLFVRSWRITWNNKFLWVLGFLAALTSASNGGSSGRSVSQQFNSGEVSPEMITAFSGAVLLLVCVGFLFGLLLAFVGLAANGGLISAVGRLDDGEKVTLGEAFAAGTQAIFRLLGIGILLWLPFVLIIVLTVTLGVVGTGGIAAASDIANNPESLVASLGFLAICLVALCCTLIPVGIVVSVIYEFALRGTVLHNLGVVDSIRQAWQLIRANLGEVIVLMIVLFGVGLLVGLLLGIVMLPLGLLILVPVIAMAGSGSTPNVASIGLLIGGGFCLGILGALLNSVIVTWRSAAITLAYRQFTGKFVKAA